MDFNATVAALLFKPRQAARQIVRPERLAEGLVIYAAALLAGAVFFRNLPNDLPAAFREIFPHLAVGPISMGLWLRSEAVGVIIDAVSVGLLCLALRTFRGKITLLQTLGLLAWLHLVYFPVLIGSQLAVTLRNPDLALIAALVGLAWTLYAGLSCVREVSGVRTPTALISLGVAIFGAPALTAVLLVRGGLLTKEDMMLVLMMR